MAVGSAEAKPATRAPQPSPIDPGNPSTEGLASASSRTNMPGLRV